MAYTAIQELRKRRAENKGLNRRTASTLRKIADWLDKKGPEEFSASEIKTLKALARMIKLRLEMNATTKEAAKVLAQIQNAMKKAGTWRAGQPLVRKD